MVVAFLALAINANRDGGSGGGGSTNVSSAAGATTVNVTLSDYKITLDQEKIPAGPVTVVVTNTSATPHNFAIPGLGKTKNLNKGESETLQLGSLEPGTFAYVCEIPGHKDLGMSGKLVVVKAGVAKPAAVCPPHPLPRQPVAPRQPRWPRPSTTRPSTSPTDGSSPTSSRASRPRPEGLGGLPLASKVENGVKVFDLTAKVVQWEMSPGKKFEAWTYNGTVPGPEIRIKQGETIKVRLKNELPESTSIHWHGLELADNTQDGVTFVTQDPIAPGPPTNTPLPRSTAVHTCITRTTLPMPRSRSDFSAGSSLSAIQRRCRTSPPTTRNTPKF